MKSSPVQVVVADLHHRITGVSTTIRALLPSLSAQLSLAFLAQVDHEDVPKISLYQAWKICRSPLPAGRKFRIWHARRNNEMFWGLLFKHLLRCPLKLVFTSAAKRKHSWFPRQLIRGMDAIIATSEVAASYMSQVVQVIPHGVDTERFLPAADQRLLKREFGLQKKYAIGIIGRIRPEKGTDLFVKSLCKLFPEHPEFEACVIGLVTPQYLGFEKELRKKITQAGLESRFHWLGQLPIDKMPKIQAALDITVAPARYEGYGMVPLEAMACANAVVASDTGAYRTMILEGETGWVVPVEDQEGLTQKLDALMQDELKIKSMGLQGLSRVKQNFSVQGEVQAILNVYRQLWDS